ncbi:hypothetical protein R1sor_004273 [Riccia sorocarpa]|uniref:Retrovirus-related Pol polyprotein from transposon TNT 1-94-like beta-barrel domain-containing protein n=1 Tax=Riccia sorocarpa TaxID=122646 RepID=A0ABD3H650_9MARC
MAHVNLKPPSFEGQNFLGWKKLMTLHAMGEDWLDHMEGKDKCPTIVDPNDKAQVAAYRNRVQRDRKIVHINELCVSQSIVMRLDLKKTSTEIWKWLGDTYEKQGEAPKLLERELRLREEGGSAGVEQAKFVHKKSWKSSKGGSSKETKEKLHKNQCRNYRNLGTRRTNVDSGCTSSMVKDQDLLHNCKKGSGSVKLGSNAEIPMGPVGALALEVGRKKIELTEVLHVPNLRRNLQGVSKLADMGLVTIFDRNKVIFYESGAKIRDARLA